MTQSGKSVMTYGVIWSAGKMQALRDYLGSWTSVEDRVREKKMTLRSWLLWLCYVQVMPQATTRKVRSLALNRFPFVLGLILQ